ncbi:MAG: hypothetical protein A2Z20_05335 [Bdellovibrionales bacterium RBG_16_40_8]|nr:MAG: hypothetical protein A2Z20_05335 [Bdellovibrionales bacterium RBG_16_40_8]
MRITITRVYSITKGAFQRFFDLHGLFLASALAFNLLLYSLPIFLIGLSLLSKMGPDSEKFINFYISTLEQFLPHQPTGSSKIFSSVDYTNVGLHPINLLTLLLVGGSLLGTVRIIARIIFGKTEKIRALKAKVIDMALIVLIGSIFGISIIMSFAFSSVYTLLSRLSHVGAFLDPTFVLLGLLLKLGLIFLIFFSLFRTYGKKELTWPATTIGAVITTILFAASKYILDIYILLFAPSSLIYGALGAFVFYFVWLYYSSLAFVFGASVSWSIAQNGK